MPSIVRELIRLDFAFAAEEGWIAITDKGIAALSARPKA